MDNEDFFLSALNVLQKLSYDEKTSIAAQAKNTFTKVREWFSAEIEKESDSKLDFFYSLAESKYDAFYYALAITLEDNRLSDKNSILTQQDTVNAMKELAHQLRDCKYVTTAMIENKAKTEEVEKLLIESYIEKIDAMKGEFKEFESDFSMQGDGD